jgi:anaerobic magnesium-protoporphyrin IX monomethyl ester cyclase
MNSKRIILTTLPKEGTAVQWVTPKYFQPDDSKYIPLGLLSLATNLPSKHEVLVLDPFSNNWGLEETIERIEKENPDILGISAMTFSSYQMKEILSKTSARYKVVGGPHATHNAEVILSQGADAVFVGQLADLEFSEATDAEPKGIVYCNTKINQIRFPDRRFIDIESYFPKGNLFKSNKRMPMFSGVGCPHRCRFCDVQTRHIERKISSSVLEEMIYLKDIGAGSIHVYEDNFNTDEVYLRQICSEMDRRDFRFEWSGRGEAKMSLDTAKMLKDRGFKRIHVGIESLSDKTLRWFRKAVSYSQIQNFCSTMNETGIDMVGFFIVGAPTETEEDRKTMFTKVKMLNIKYPLVNILQPLPNTEYYSDLLKEGTYVRDYWAEYIRNPVPNFMVPFPCGEAKWRADADFVEQMTHEIEAWKKERGETDN